MPAKAPIDENVKFLFACLIRSDYKTIDFTRVAADFNINPAAARMRWSRLKKTINVDDIAASILEGKKRRMSKARPFQPSVKMEKVEDGASQPPPPAASTVGIMLKEKEEVALPEQSTPALFAGLPEPPKCKKAGAEEQVIIPVVDEVMGAAGGFPATQVPHLPRVAKPAVETAGAPETESQPSIPHKPPPTPVVQAQVPPMPKSEPEAQLKEEGEENANAVKPEDPPADTICKNSGSTVMVVPTADGSKKRKVEST